jgi:HK97 family phage major capsid protein
MTNEKNYLTGTPEYDRHFWNAVRGAKIDTILEDGRNGVTDAYALPIAANNKFTAALTEQSLFRQIGTTVAAYNSGHRIFAHDCDDVAQWVPEGGKFAILNGANDFTRYSVDRWKLGALVKLDEDFVRDVTFNVEDYLVQRLAKNFGRAEDAAFISGTGVQMPTGILNATGGAEIGCSGSVTYDDVIKLYFSVKPEYRKNGIWLMNDETALALHTLKDSAGNYLWRESDDTILGKRVAMNNAMPSAAAGAKPIVFGDFSYYWVIVRSAVSVLPIVETFTLNQQIGYLAFEFLDGKLIRPEAVKVLQIA